MFNFGYQSSFSAFQFQPMSFGGLGSSFGFGFPCLPPVSMPMGGNYLGESNFWAQTMQAQQNLFQGWQGFCGCPGQQRPQFGNNCRPREVEVHHHYHYHDCPPQQTEPRPTTPRPTTPRPTPQPPLTRTPPIPSPPPQVQTRPLPTVPAAATPDQRTNYAAHAFQAPTNGAGGVGGVMMTRSNFEAQGLGQVTTSSQTHRTSVTVNGRYVG